MLRQTKKRGSTGVSSKGKRKKAAWKHNFFCLAYVGQDRLPTSEAEKDELFEARLGLKEIEFEHLDLTAEQFKEVLFESFPQLRAAGGYQLCKCMPNS